MEIVVTGIALVVLSYLLSQAISWALRRPQRSDKAVNSYGLAVASSIIAVLACITCVFPPGTLFGAVVALTLSLVARRHATGSNVSWATIAVMLAVIAMAFGLLGLDIVISSRDGPL